MWLLRGSLTGVGAAEGVEVLLLPFHQDVLYLPVAGCAMGRRRYGYVIDKTMCVSVVYIEMQSLLSQTLSSTKYNHMVNAEGLPQILL